MEMLLRLLVALNWDMAGTTPRPSVTWATPQTITTRPSPRSKGAELEKFPEIGKFLAASPHILSTCSTWKHGEEKTRYFRKIRTHPLILHFLPAGFFKLWTLSEVRILGVLLRLLAYSSGRLLMACSGTYKSCR